MEKEIMKKVVFCDNCGKEATYSFRCVNCGKRYCSDCEQTCITEYQHGVFFSGSGDGYFCNSPDCIIRPEIKPLLNAYQLIQSLREESNRWNADFRSRCDAAEHNVEMFRGILRAKVTTLPK